MSTNNKWGALSMRDRAFLIREAVRNGITDINSIRDLYNQNGERIKLGTPYRTFESGSDYDYFNAAPENIPQENDGHWSSRNPHTGQLLKSPNHPTYNLLLEGEKQAGYKVQKIGDREYSFPNAHRFDGESDQPTEDEYIAQRAKEKIVEALNRARVAKDIPEVFVEKGWKLQERDDELYNQAVSNLNSLKQEYQNLMIKKLSPNVKGPLSVQDQIDIDYLESEIPKVEEHVKYCKTRRDNPKTSGATCINTVTGYYDRNETWNERFAKQTHGELGFRKISDQEIEPGDIVQFGEAIQNPNTGEWEIQNPGHALMANTKYNADSSNMRWNGSNGDSGEGAVRINSTYPSDWETMQAYRFVGNKTDSLQWKKEYREKYGHQFSGEDNNEINWKAVGSTLYDIGEIVDPTGISSWATPEGDLYQAVKNYKEGTGSAGDVALNVLGALPILGPIGKAIKIGKGGAKIAKTISKAAKNAKVIDDFLELIPGIKKATSATQAVTGTVTQALGDALDLSSNARFWTNKGIQVLNTANTMSDVGGAVANSVNRSYNTSSPATSQEGSNTETNKALLDASRRLEEEENSKNNRRGGWDEKNKRWYPHPSPEDGAHTIGYGIKLNPNNKWTKVVDEQGYLTEDQERQARLEMLEESERVARTSYDNRFGKGEWDKLDFKPQSLLIDRVYNAGSISTFPKFVKAIHDGDLEGMRDQYKVYMTKGRGKRKRKVELGRNKTISKEIDSLEQGFYPIFKEN